MPANAYKQFDMSRKERKLINVEQQAPIIASITGNDRITQIHITNLLLSHNIESSMEGSLIYGVSVASPNAQQAIELLRSDATNNGYYVWFGGKDVIRAAKPKPRVIVSRVPISSILERPEFASDAALGKFLRSKDIAELAVKYPYVISVSVLERQYLATPKTHATGYEVDIKLQKSLRAKDDGCRRDYQVYNGGSNVVSFGVGEWHHDK
jgi:hypothetical protein